VNHPAGFEKSARGLVKFSVAGDLCHDFIERPTIESARHSPSRFHSSAIASWDFPRRSCLGRDLELKTCVVDVELGKAKDIAQADSRSAQCSSIAESQRGGGPFFFLPGFIGLPLIRRANFLLKPQNSFFGFDYLKRLDQTIRPRRSFTRKPASSSLFSFLKKTGTGRHRSNGKSNRAECRANAHRTRLAARAASRSRCQPPKCRPQATPRATMLEPARGHLSKRRCRCNPASSRPPPATAPEAAQDPPRQAYRATPAPPAAAAPPHPCGACPG